MLKCKSQVRVNPLDFRTSPSSPTRPDHESFGAIRKPWEIFIPMASFEFELSNLDGVLDRLQRFGQDVVDAADEEVIAATGEAYDAVLSGAPVDTGRLRASVEKSHLGWGIGVVSVGESVPYTRAVEAKVKFFNRAIAPVQIGLLDRVGDAIIKKAFS